ncbi:HK97 family phage prohead protease [Bradyrhizobium ontarionense]|uniref:HK97 family phage prohead protease n=1 Tax=Bradyrhizobium ontarionense TaxID=2898149 RepID=A0ABY3R841_9BRAD|nr:HK97 family phage prohead protease [Bradyrhizobium sp. A19]UFZ02928.1 HK97 family phage prohead protease [Bradyrhizobium sp. A19]
MNEPVLRKIPEIDGVPLSIKFAGTDTPGTLEGYASTFGNVDLGGDVVAPGAFTKTLADHRAAGTMPAMLWHHRSGEPIGKWIEMEQDPAGLRVKGRLTLEVARAREAYALARDGVLSMSIGYRATDTGRSNGNRVLKTVRLDEVSLLPLPMNTSARIMAVKSAAEVSRITDLRAFEEFLRDAGFSRAFAKAVAIHGFKAAAGLRDADGADTARHVRDQATAFANAIKGLSK